VVSGYPIPVLGGAEPLRIATAYAALPLLSSKRLMKHAESFYVEVIALHLYTSFRTVSVLFRFSARSFVGSFKMSATLHKLYHPFDSNTSHRLHLTEHFVSV
jgi:hypothetical protein